MGYEFIIRLPSNPTTGYQWETATPLEGGSLKLIETHYQQEPVAGEKKVGVGGHRDWTYQGTGPGETKLTFDYRRPWEKDQPPADSKTFTIVIAGDPLDENLLSEDTALI